MPWLADSRPGAEAKYHAVSLDVQRAHVEHLHGALGRTDLESKPGIGIEFDPCSDLAEDRPELGYGHEIPPALGGQVFNL